RHPVQVRKPEKETKPKLFYIEGDEASLVPNRARADGRSMWSRGAFVSADRQTAEPTNGVTSLPVMESPRRAYDVRPRAPAWGWPVAAYTLTKSIAAGALLGGLAARIWTGTENAARLAVPLGALSLVFLVATAALLVGDLKRPDRFLYVLLRPQWRSWLVRGAYILT